MTEGWTVIHPDIFSYEDGKSACLCVCIYVLVCTCVLLLMLWLHMHVLLSSYWVLDTVSFFSINIPITSQKCSL